MEQARENASKVGKIPVVFLKEKGNKRRAVRLDYGDFLTLFQYMLKGHEAPDLSIYPEEA